MGIKVTYKICWQDKQTLECGCGAGGLSKKLATINVEKLNREFPGIEHWIEPDKESQTYL